MESLSGRLNVKEHLAGARMDNIIACYSAADIEGHLGADNRFYIIDFSRAMPPVAYEPSLPASNLFRLFRPEFVLSYPHPLCPDGYSGFVKHDPMKRTYISVWENMADTIMIDRQFL